MLASEPPMRRRSAADDGERQAEAAIAQTDRNIPKKIIDRIAVQRRPNWSVAQPR